MSYKLLVYILVSIFIRNGLSHTVSFGYASDSTTCDTTVWSGTYHDLTNVNYPPFHGPEGICVIQGVTSLPSGTTPAVLDGSNIHSHNFTVYSATKPAGLADGQNNFFSGMSGYGYVYKNDSKLYNGVTDYRPRYHQGAIFRGVTPGWYYIYYDSTSVFDDVFRPMTGLTEGIYIYVSCTNSGNANGYTYIAASNQDSLMCDLRNALFSKAGAVPTNWDCSGQTPTTPVCSWSGVLCSNGAVLTVDLGSNSLVYSWSSTACSNADASAGTRGSLPSTLGGISTLKSLVINTCGVASTLPTSMGDLTRMSVLSLKSNSMTGSLPSALGNLINLNQLDLSGNVFAGSIPTSFGNFIHMLVFSLGNNKLTGRIPTQFGYMYSLTSLDMNTNKLTGGIPSQFSSISYLNTLQLQSNSLSGYIGSYLCTTSHLAYMFLSSNRFSCYAPCLTTVTTLSPAGTFSRDPTVTSTCSPTRTPTVSPTSISQDIVMCQLGYAMFGTTNNPSNWGCTGLTPNSAVCGPPGWRGVVCTGGVVTNIELSFVSATSTGSISSYIGYLTGLKEFNITHSSIHGTMPTQFGMLSGVLTYLNLGFNSITGSIPSQMSTLTLLTFLDLMHNSIAGSIPAQLSLLTNLRSLYLGDNLITKTIPVGLSKLSLLKTLDLGGNKITGTVPSQLGSLSVLTWLDLGVNKLTGSISSGICGMTALNTLDITVNTGLVCYPACVSTVVTNLLYTSATTYKCPSTQDINMCLLSHALFTGGTTPASWACQGTSGDVPTNNVCTLWVGVTCDGNGVVTGINLGAGDGVSGTIPTAIGSLTGLSSLNLVSSNLHGAIPTQISSLTSLSYLNLYSNALTGSIQTSLSALTKLSYLNLASNSIAGSMPSQLSTLTNLAYFWVGNNQLVGSIPAAYGSWSVLRGFGIGHNRITGSIPFATNQLTQIQTFQVDRNLLTGFVPASLCGFTGIQMMNLTNNHFSCAANCLSSTVAATAASYSIDGSLTSYSCSPTSSPTSKPTGGPTFAPTSKPTVTPTISPSRPTSPPTVTPTRLPTSIPSSLPTTPSVSPTITPTNTRIPTTPTVSPTQKPTTYKPTTVPTAPTFSPTRKPTNSPSLSYPTLQNYVMCQFMYGLVREASKPALWGCSTGTPDNSVCNWSGVTCTGGLITCIQVVKQSLPGTISSTLGLLTKLQCLTISSNPATGNIPSSLSQLSSLTTLNLANNKLSGTVPSVLSSMTSLSTLNVGNNALTGSISSTLCSVTALDVIDMTGNNFLCYPSCSTAVTILKSASVTLSCAAFTPVPTSAPASVPTSVPTVASVSPTQLPSSTPTQIPVSAPTSTPSTIPSVIPSMAPSAIPTDVPSVIPTAVPTALPSAVPTSTPTERPSVIPTEIPTSIPSSIPTERPSTIPTDSPSSIPSVLPSVLPSSNPTVVPSVKPTSRPTIIPTGQPTGNPTVIPDTTLMCLIWAGLQMTASTSTVNWGCSNGYQPNVPLCGTSWTGTQWVGTHWTGVICDENGDVIAIATTGMAAQGSLSTYIGAITSLQTLDLQANSIEGSIPQTVTSLTNLKELNLGKNQISGTIDPGLGNLRDTTILVLSSNDLTNCIPTTLGQLTKLVDLNLKENSLACSIPSQLGSLPALTSLNLRMNRIGGTIPTSLGSDDNLVNLVLSNNELSSVIPSTLSKLTDLTNLDLSNNNLQGTIPPSFGLLPKVVNMDFQANSLGSSIPSQLGSLTTLTSLNLGGNSFVGTIPTTLGQLSQLSSLVLSSNAFTGQVPSTLCQVTSLTQLNLNYNNQLTSMANCIAASPIVKQTFPTGQPSTQPTGQPSGRPSDQPSGQPTSRPTPQPSSQPTGQPSGQPTSSPTHPACILFNLMDTFGDGWNTAFLQIKDSVGYAKSFQPSATSSYNSNIQYCIDPSMAVAGSTVTAGLTGVSPLQPWEDFFTANAGSSPIYGKFNTFITFRLVGTVGNYRFVVASYHGIVPQTKTCEACKKIEPEKVQADPIEIESPAVSVPTEGSLKGIDKAVKSGKEDLANSKNNNNNNKGSNKEKTNIMNNNKKSVEEIAKRAEAHGKVVATTVATTPQSPITPNAPTAATTVKVDYLSYRLYSLNGEWSSWSGYGSTFDISSIDGSTLYFQGGLCHGDSLSTTNHCDLSSLEPGPYIWRVTGAPDSMKNTLAWDFCGVHGGAMTELIFEITGDNTCIPLTTSVVDTTQFASHEALETDEESDTSTSWRVSSNVKKWLITGQLVFKSNHYEFLNTLHKKHVFKYALANLLNAASVKKDLQSNDVSITKWTVDTGAAVTRSSPLTEGNDVISMMTFEVSMVPESFGFDSGYDESEGSEYLKEGVDEYLSVMIQSGVFGDSVYTVANSLDISDLQNIQTMTMNVNMDTTDGYSLDSSSHVYGESQFDSADTTTERTTISEMLEERPIFVGTLAATIIIISITILVKFSKRSTKSNIVNLGLDLGAHLSPAVPASGSGTTTGSSSSSSSLNKAGKFSRPRLSYRESEGDDGEEDNGISVGSSRAQVVNTDVLLDGQIVDTRIHHDQLSRSRNEVDTTVI